MITFPQIPSIPAEHPCGNHDNVCAKSDGSRIFGIPHSQDCRTGRAKLNLSMRKNPHENAFSLFATLVKRVKTYRRPKNFIFSKPFFATKTTVFCTPTCPKPTRKPFFAYIHEKKQNRLFEKRPYNPPPPPPPPSPTLSVGAAFFRGPNAKKTWDPLRCRDLVVVVVGAATDQTGWVARVALEQALSLPGFSS